MSEEGGFLLAIRREPDEPAHRLVYADWLEERGDPRAEYVRLSHEVARLRARLAAMRPELDAAWVDALREGGERPDVDVTLVSGRHIHLRELRQHHTYGGLIEGLPTTELNRRIIDRVVAEESRGGHRPHLIPPREVPIKWDGPYFGGRFGQPASLPLVACVGQLTSHQTTASAGPHDDHSGLAVIWFQDRFALPIDPEIWTQLRAIDWDSLAANWAM